jgi:hypothetical protein
LKAVLQDKKMQAGVRVAVLCLKDLRVQAPTWVDLARELWIVLVFERPQFFVHAFVLDVTLLKYQWSVHLHASLLTLFLTFNFLHLDFYLLCRMNWFAFDLLMHCNSFSRFLGNNFVELASVILRWEREIFGNNDLSENVLAINVLKSHLVLISKDSEDAL